MLFAFPIFYCRSDQHFDPIYATAKIVHVCIYYHDDVHIVLGNDAFKFGYSRFFTEDGTEMYQVRSTPAARLFWVFNNPIAYIDFIFFCFHELAIIAAEL